MLSFVVIPARLHSTRLHRKLLLRETGKSIIRHTYEAASRAKRSSGICVATDSDEIVNEVRSFGGRSCMTSVNCASGLDRIAEATRHWSSIDIVVNVQGDEPELDAAHIDRLIEHLVGTPDAMMATLATPITTREELYQRSAVKVVFDAGGRALYFSRAIVPSFDEVSGEADGNIMAADPPIFYRHVGVYAYRRDFLQVVARLPRSRLEQVENLEQLRILEAGHRIDVLSVGAAPPGIDTRLDYDRFVFRHKTGNGYIGEEGAPLP